MAASPQVQYRVYAFRSRRSLLRFPIMTSQKITFDDLPYQLTYSLTRRLEQMQSLVGQRTRLLRDLKQIAICKPADKSMIAIFRSVTSANDYRAGQAGGLANMDMGEIFFCINSIPRATFSCLTSFKVRLLRCQKARWSQQRFSFLRCSPGHRPAANFGQGLLGGQAGATCFSYPAPQVKL